MLYHKRELDSESYGLYVIAIPFQFYIQTANHHQIDKDMDTFTNDFVTFDTFK